MKDRIAHIMRAKNLKASDFASLLGIQPSAISHILSGRNQPSLDLVKKIKETFPEYNLDWIVLGSGPITTSEPLLFKPSEIPLSNDFPSENTASDSPVEVPETPISEISPIEAPPSPIKSMVILYNDGTFESYRPR